MTYIVIEMLIEIIKLHSFEMKGQLTFFNKSIVNRYRIHKNIISKTLNMV